MRIRKMVRQPWPIGYGLRALNVQPALRVFDEGAFFLGAIELDSQVATGRIRRDNRSQFSDRGSSPKSISSLTSPAPR
jgi:hypothetical protein